LHSHQRIDPLANAGVLLEEPGIGQIETARVADLVIEHRDLAMQPQIRASGQQAEETGWQSGLNLNTNSSQIRGQGAGQKRCATDGIDQNPAGHSACGGPDQGSANVVGTATGAPDVEFQIATSAGPVDVLN